MALLAVSDRDPGGDELIWTGATAPPTTNTREEQLRDYIHTYNSWQRVLSMLLLKRQC